MKKENTLRRNMFIKTMYIMKLPSILLLVISLHFKCFCILPGNYFKGRKCSARENFQEIKKTE